MSSITKPFIGVWQNHSNGVFTLTLREREAGILSAALVIFIGFVASQAWSITKFVLHQLRVTGTARDGFHHQQQAALRNSSSHTQALWLTLRLAIGWRRRIGAMSVIWRSSFLLGISFISLAAWSVAQLFISLVWTTTGPQFLVEPNFCGMVDPGLGPWQQMIVYSRDRLDSASIYQRQCYTEGAETSECSGMPVPKLGWSAEDASCPFAEPDLCIFTNSTPMRMQSDYINSNTHLGVNAKPEDAIEYRKTATCSPMRSSYAYTVPDGDEIQYRYYYGYFSPVESNATFNYSTEYLRLKDGYRISQYSYDPGQKSTLWQPNATIFNRTDAIVSLFFLTMDYMLYFDPVYDPWFRTYPNSTINETIQGNTEFFYAPHFAATILGCIEEHELCNPAAPGGRNCSRFTSSGNSADLYSSLQLNPRQISTASRLVVDLLNAGMSDMVDLSPPLLASKTFSRGTQYAHLQNNQWKAEVSRWFTTSLSLLQHTFIEFVTGPSNPVMRAYLRPVIETLGDCDRQRIGNIPGPRNFNIVAILVVIFLGLTIIAVGISLDTLVGLCQKWLRHGNRHRLSWLLDGVFQQQRMAYEAAGVRGWDDVETPVPTTDEARFPPVDATDPSNPHFQTSVDSVDATEPKLSGVVAERELLVSTPYQ